jgi:caffeoyl-CoA O-methyltransferase
MKKYSWKGTAGILAILFILTIPGHSHSVEKETAVDIKVKKFLGKMKNQWHDLNVPEEDGKILYEIVIRNQYKKALELGTSTGHSAIWIAWALSKTGGRLITIEMDEGRYRQALFNFKEAGLEEFIDCRLGDAHMLVMEISGPFDFVFIDADKEWYPNYAKALVPKVTPGGCLTAHNVEDPGPALRGRYENGTGDYYRYMKSLPDFETQIHPNSRYGVAVSYKMKKKHLD